MPTACSSAGIASTAVSTDAFLAWTRTWHMDMDMHMHMDMYMCMRMRMDMHMHMHMDTDALLAMA